MEGETTPRVRRRTIVKSKKKYPKRGKTPRPGPEQQAEMARDLRRAADEKGLRNSEIARFAGLDHANLAMYMGKNPRMSRKMYRHILNKIKQLPDVSASRSKFTLDAYCVDRNVRRVAREMTPDEIGRALTLYIQENYPQELD